MTKPPPSLGRTEPAAGGITRESIALALKLLPHSPREPALPWPQDFCRPAAPQPEQGPPTDAHDPV